MITFTYLVFPLICPHRPLFLVRSEDGGSAVNDLAKNKFSAERLVPILIYLAHSILVRSFFREGGASAIVVVVVVGGFFFFICPSLLAPIWN